MKPIPSVTGASRRTGLTSDSQGFIEEESFPSGKFLWQTGAAIARRFKDRELLRALYGDSRTVDIMYRYFSGESLKQIGEVYGVTGERVRQICEKSLFELRQLLICFKKDVMDKQVDKDDPIPE